MRKRIKGMKAKLPVFFLATLMLAVIIGAASSAMAVEEAYWTDKATGTKLTSLDMAPGETKTIQLKADIPAGKTLNAYKFTMNYNPAVISVGPITDVVNTDKDGGPWDNAQHDHNAGTGTITANGFDVAGMDGGVAIAVLDVVVTGNAQGNFDFSIQVNNFGSTAGDFAVLPTPVNLPVTVTPVYNCYWVDSTGAKVSTVSLTVGSSTVLTLRTDILTGDVLKAFKFTANYTSAYLTASGITEKATGDDGKLFTMHINSATAGTIIFNGFSTVGKTGPGPLDLLTVTFTGKSAGNSTLDVVVNNFGNTSDFATFPVYTPVPQVTVTGGGVIPPVVVTNPPSAAFTADKTSGEAPLTVKFTDQSTNGPTSWIWDFGDGATSTLQNPEHIYTKAGTYTVKLTVSNADGTDSMTRTAYITVSAPSADKASIKVEYNVDGNKFKIRLTDVSEGSTSRTWYIDGVEVGNGASSFVHTFAQAGTYTVKMDAAGADWTDSANLQVVVKDAGVLFSVFEFGIADDKLTANFTDKSEPASVITKRVWDFGDGSAPVETTLTALSHSYAAAGEYSVKLTVYTASGESAERSLKILVPGTGGGVVVGEINSEFTASVVSGIAPLKVQFASAATATNGISTYLWSFGDGGSSSEANPLYEYKTAGTWTVKLTVVGPDGSSVKEKANLITVSLNPVLVVDVPVPVAPQDGATSLEMIEFHLVPALEIAAYGDTTNTYGATKWEIATDPAFAEINVVWREKNTSTSLMMPDFVLDYGKMYWWRVKFADVNGVESEWSQVFSFTVANMASDDSNANGILDAQLSDCETVFAGMNVIKCAKSEIGEGVFGIEAVENIMSAVFFRTYGTDYVPSEIDMPWGLTGFRVDLNATGLTAKVKIHLSAAAAADAEWYINELWPLVPKKRAGSSAAEWSADRKSVTLTLTDGGENDFDGIANGVIVVPFTGFGTAKAGDVECCDTGGSDSCFISTAAGSSYGVVMLFMAIIGAAGTIIRRK